VTEELLQYNKFKATLYTCYHASAAPLLPKFLCVSGKGGPQREIIKAGFEGSHVVKYFSEYIEKTIFTNYIKKRSTIG
jgi:hypothetical protein